MNKVKQLLTRPFQPKNTAVVIRQSAKVTLDVREAKEVMRQQTDVIIVEGQREITAYKRLSQLIETGRHYHTQAKGYFVQKWSNNHYFVKHRVEELRTCALAAAYVGSYGPNSINERITRSMVEAELEPIIGYHPGLRIITCPVLYDRRNQPYQGTSSVSALVQYLNDQEGWTRAAISRELARQGL